MRGNKILERKNAILKKEIIHLTLKDHVDGLGHQENHMRKMFLKEYYQNNYQMDTTP